MVKSGGTGLNVIVRNMQNPEWGWYFFNLLIFVKFGMFTIHILRNGYEKIEKINILSI